MAQLRLVDHEPPEEPPPSSDLHAKWIELQAAGADDPALIRLAFKHCHKMVFSTANRIRGSIWEAEDVTQSVFETFARQLSAIRDPARIPGFLKTTTVRVAMKLVRRGRWRRNRLLQADRPTGVPANRIARATLVRQVLVRLDAEERTAVVLKYVEQHTHEEAAELMGMSVPTVRRRLASAQHKLLKLLGSDGMNETFGASEVDP